jgi:desumoylating isopeptidase 1
MHALLKTHRAVVAFFTSQGCPPCGMISPVFETLAREKGGREGVAFTKIDLGAGLGGSVASEWAVRVTPTFLFFLDGKKVGCPLLIC